MSIQHEKENKQITQDQVNELLTHETRVATNMEKVKTGYDANYYSMEKTMQDRQLIDDLLKLPESTTLKLSDEQKYRLKTIQGRNISHMLLNQNAFTGDSSEMKAVKKHVQELEQLMSQPLQKDTMLQSIENLQIAYMDALASCRYYCEHKDPSFESGRERKQAVMDTYQQLKKESEQLTVAKKLMENGQLTEEVTNPQDLLVAAQKSMAANQSMPQQQKTGIQALTFDSFAMMIGTYNRGQVEFDGKGLKMINNGKFSLSSGRASIENRKIREQFLAVVLERLGIEDARILQNRLEKQLGLDDESEELKPLSRKVIKDVVAMVNDRTSLVEKLLRETELLEEEEKKAQSARDLAAEEKRREDSTKTQVQLEEEQKAEEERQKALEEARQKEEAAKTQEQREAEQAEKRRKAEAEKKLKMKYACAKTVNQMIGGNLKVYERAHTTAEQEALLKKEITTILDRARELGTKVPQLSKHQMDNLVRGNISKLRDRIFRSIYQTYEAMNHLNGGEAVDEKLLLENNDAITRMAAFAIVQEAATSELGAEYAKYDLKLCMQNTAFQLSGKQDLEQDFTKGYVGNLAFRGSLGLEHSVEKRLAKNKTWQSDKRRLKRGMDALANLCEKLQTLTAYEKKAFGQGLTGMEAAKLETLGLDIQTMLTSDVMQDMQFVADGLKDTRFHVGFEQAKSLVTGENPISFETVTKHISDAAKMKDEQQELADKSFRYEIKKADKEEIYGHDILLEAFADRMKTEQARAVAKVFFMMADPAILIKNKQDEQAKELRYLRDVLRAFPMNQEYAENIYLAGVNIRLEQNESNLLKFFMNGQSIRLSANAKQLADRLELDMVKGKSKDRESGEELYGTVNVLQLIQGLQYDAANLAEVKRIRNLCVHVLEAKTGFSNTFFDSTTTKDLRNLAILMLRGELTKEQLENTVNEYQNQNIDQINDAETQELLKKLAMQDPSVVEQKVKIMPSLLKAPETDEVQLTEEEKQVKNLIEELLFSEETWKMDEMQEDKGTRIKRLLLKHVDGLSAVLCNPKILESALDKLALTSLGEEAGIDFKNQFRIFIEDFLNSDTIKNFKGLFKNSEWLSSVLKYFLDETGDEKMPFSLRAALYLYKKSNDLEISVEEIANNLRDELLEHLEGLETEVDQAIGSGMNMIQEIISDAVDEAFQTDEDETLQQTEQNQKAEQQAVQNEQNTEQKAVQDPSEILGNIIAQETTGTKGQGMFIQKVLKTYFAQMPAIDQRSMLASALRNLKPQKPLPEFESENKAMEDEYLMAQQQQRKKTMAALLGGLLKGAGPLLQKMLQGMPLDSLPEELKSALQDMKSNLAPIPDEIVKARMLGIVENSGGTITKIEINKSMGAASVGQVFLCTIYGPNMPTEGNEVVIKLLRPDARNRMMREKKVMTAAAKDTGEGMLATYLGQLERIEEELDFRIEARNAQAGQIYNERFEGSAENCVRCVKVNQLAEPTANTLMLEKAGGETLDKILRDAHTEFRDMMNPFYVHDENGDVQTDDNKEPQMQKLTAANAHQLIEVRQKLAKKASDLRIAVPHLLELAQKWVNEGIFGREGSGFYHGDLHAGNIMMDLRSDIVTVIDFGNATILNSDQQRSIIRMILAAQVNQPEDFIHEFHNLMSKEKKYEETYQKQKEAYTQILKEVFAIGRSENVGQRVLVALLKAQSLGIALPTEIINFSNSQVRLANSIKELNDIILSYEKAMKQLSEQIDQVDAKVDPICMAKMEMLKQAENPMNHLSKRVDDLKPITQENFKDQVNEKTQEKREAFDEACPVQTRYREWMNNVEAFQTLAQVSNEELPKQRDAFKEKLFKQLEQMRVIAAPEETASFNELQQNLEQCLQQPSENVQRFRELVEQLAQSMRLTEYQKDLDDYRKLQDQDLSGQKRDAGNRRKELKNAINNETEETEKAKKTQELKAVEANIEHLEQEISKMDALQTKLFEIYEKHYTYDQVQNHDYMKNVKAFLELENNPKNAEQIQALEQELEIWFLDEKNHGTQLREAYQELRTAQKEKSADLAVKEYAFLSLFSKASYRKLNAYYNALGIRPSSDKLEDFMDAMCDVINTKSQISLAKKMGIVFGQRYEKLLAEVEKRENPDKEDDTNNEENG